MPHKGEKKGLVWSSDPDAAQPPDAPSPGNYPPPGKQVARLTRSRQGRAGKTVIVIEGLELPPEGYRDLAHHLRQALGTGGTVKGKVIEIQGDIRDRVAEILAARGYRIKRVGG